jgi:tol-pal system protein YbgF
MFHDGYVTLEPSKSEIPPRPPLVKEGRGDLEICFPSNSSQPILGGAVLPRGWIFKGGKLKKLCGIKTWIVLSIGILLLGCASVRDVRTLDREIDKAYLELNALRKENNLLKDKMSTLSAENQKLKTDLLIRVDNLQSEVRTLSTGVEEYKEYLKRPSKEIGQVKADVEARLKGLEEGRRNLEEKNKAQEEKIREMEFRLKAIDEKVKETGSEKMDSTKELPSRPKRTSAGMKNLYKDAYDTLQKKDLEGARKKFEAFLKQYPNTELSGNAHFWIGEIYYQKKDFEKAILEYEKAITKYPETDKVPAALFKQALAFLELGDKGNARNLLKRVIERFPRSKQAEMAKKKLETIK